MSSSPEDIAALAGQAKTVAPAGDRQPSFFLSLAPATSSSYPQRKASAPETDAAPVAATVAAPTESAAAVVDAKQRRSSSLSSSGSNSTSTGVRILKLGPVHWGEHLDESKHDWHEVVFE
ncbi:hypothetical protein SPBR_08000 [Sporothrix brasiliensis 5110]|uniref:Uncharacterized protein n=1 Tax=Sporothrix brasiliensis 5110 TaxID=1398154 RepID=A0A0C2EPS1_9PEZI|nr:uncharacterized protein SPBR_08000 [Sporothrix brasiliensis 5110]KIH88274.1 hypothetical protein SPBR_08000 [Sporothrix brasiliensis 5110]